MEGQFGVETNNFNKDLARSMSHDSRDIRSLPIALTEAETEQVRKEFVELANKGELLGSGQTADVFTYRSPFFQERVCCKIINKDRQKPINDLETEFDILQRAREAGVRVPKPLAHIRDSKKNKEYLLMQRIRGRTLTEYFNSPQRKFFLKEEYHAWRTELARMIKLLHNANIYHRDLHIGNVMIGDDAGELYIIDFGQAKQVIFSEEMGAIYAHKYKRISISRQLVDVHETLLDDERILSVLKNYL